MYKTEKWLVYEWKDFFKDVDIFIEKLRPIIYPEYRKPGETRDVFLQPTLLFMHRKIDGIYAIPNGGNVLGTCLHYRLKLPMLLAPTGNSLVVDEIVDMGKTIAHYMDKGNLCISLFYNKKKSLYVPHEWLHEKLDDWIHFPWEDPEDGDDRLA